LNYLHTYFIIQLAITLLWMVAVRCGYTCPQHNFTQIYCYKRMRRIMS